MEDHPKSSWFYSPNFGHQFGGTPWQFTNDPRYTGLDAIFFLRSSFFWHLGPVNSDFGCRFTNPLDPQIFLHKAQKYPKVRLTLHYFWWQVFWLINQNIPKWFCSLKFSHNLISAHFQHFWPWKVGMMTYDDRCRYIPSALGIGEGANKSVDPFSRYH